MLLITLIFIAVVLTSTMFATKQSMLGFACALFWALAGAQSYTLSTTPWGDLYFYLFFGAGFGMTAFTALAAFGLREKRDTLADEETDEQVGKDASYVDEKTDNLDALFGTEEPQSSKRTLALRERAKKRRSGEFRPQRDNR